MYTHSWCYDMGATPKGVNWFNLPLTLYISKLAKLAKHSSANDFQWNNEASVAWPWVSRTSWHVHNEMPSGTMANMVASINFRGSWDYQGVESMLYFLLEKGQIFYRKVVNWILTLVVGMQGPPDCSQASVKIYEQSCDTLELILWGRTLLMGGC